MWTEEIKYFLWIKFLLQLCAWSNFRTATPGCLASRLWLNPSPFQSWERQSQQLRWGWEFLLFSLDTNFAFSNMAFLLDCVLPVDRGRLLISMRESEARPILQPEYQAGQKCQMLLEWSPSYTPLTTCNTSLFSQPLSPQVSLYTTLNWRKDAFTGGSAGSIWCNLQNVPLAEHPEQYRPWINLSCFCFSIICFSLFKILYIYLFIWGRGTLKGRAEQERKGEAELPTEQGAWCLLYPRTRDQDLRQR